MGRSEISFKVVSSVVACFRLALSLGTKRVKMRAQRLGQVGFKDSPVWQLQGGSMQPEPTGKRKDLPTSFRAVDIVPYQGMTEAPKMPSYLVFSSCFGPYPHKRDAWQVLQRSVSGDGFKRVSAPLVFERAPYNALLSRPPKGERCVRFRDLVLRKHPTYLRPNTRVWRGEDNARCGPVESMNRRECFAVRLLEPRHQVGYPRVAGLMYCHT